jgi:hypothetical protein
MERLFSPCTRLYDLLVENDEDDLDHDELPDYMVDPVEELNLDVSTEEFLSAERGFTYADLYAMLGNEDTVAWLTPHASVMRESGKAEYSWTRLFEASRPFCINADGKEIMAWALSPEHLLELCDVVLQLLAASVVHSLDLDSCFSTSISAFSLEYLMEQCHSLKIVSLQALEMDETHCHVLGGYSRPGLKIELTRCRFTSAGMRALAEVLGRNQGPTSLHSCRIDNFVIANGLRGNSRLKSFGPYFSEDLDVDVGSREILAIADAVRENKGLIELNVRCYSFIVNNETWGAVCDSLKTHPTLEVLDLSSRIDYIHEKPPEPLDVITLRTQTLVEMLKVNTSIHTICVDFQYREHEIYRESVIPYLETNRFRPRLLAIQKTRPIAYRAKVLGRALLAARSDANRSWMLLSGNAEVAFPSRTTTIAAPANLLTTATSTANAAAVASSVMPAFSASAGGSLPAAAAIAAAASAAIPSTASASDAPAVTNAATSSTGQKRKACS